MVQEQKKEQGEPRISKKASDHFDLRLSENLQVFSYDFFTLLKRSRNFHLGFLSIFLLELFSLLIFFPLAAESRILPLAIGGAFLTGFSYFALRFYFSAYNSENMMEIRSTFLGRCKEIIPFSPSDAEYNLSLAHSMYEACSQILNIEYHLFPKMEKARSLAGQFQKLSCFLHWQKALKMREMLLFVAIQENISLVKRMPTDLEAHASLANSYRLLSKVYLSPDKQSYGQMLPYIPKAFEKEEITSRFQKASMRAVEEYKILDGFRPNDPWVHEQLATIYRDLEKPEDEIREYELICKLRKRSPKHIFRLGALYFEQGENAKGLEIYDELRKTKDPQSEILIGLYHAVSSEEYNPDDF